MSREEANKLIMQACERTWNEKTCKEIFKALEQEPCDDAVSREAVLKIIDGWYEQNKDAENIEDLIVLITYMDSVTQKSGKWIKVTNGRGGHECNICHEYAPSYQDGDEYLTKYCPNCGAKMVEPQERSE